MEPRVILIADNNRQDVLLTCRVLGDSRIANPILMAVDGNDALDYLFGRGKYTGRNVSLTPVLTFLQSDLPVINGAQVLQQMRDNLLTANLPVIVMNSPVDPQHRIKRMMTERDVSMSKPLDFGKLTEAMKLLGLYWMVDREAIPAGA